MMTRRAVFLALAVLLILGFARANAFIGPGATPPDDTNALLKASSTRALEIATNTVFSTKSYLLFRTLGGSNQHIIFSPNGNVGIGDTSPAALLTVGSGDLFQVNSSGAIAASTGIINSGGYTQSGTTVNTFTGTPTFSNATYSALFTGGNVGIGTTTPSYKLDVAGSVSLRGTTTPSVYGLRVDSSGQVGIGGGPITEEVLTVVGGIYSEAIGANAAAQFANSEGGNIVSISSISNSLAVLTGNVGIGTSTPASPLSIHKEQNRTAYTGTAKGLVHLVGGTNWEPGDITAITLGQSSFGTPVSIIGTAYTAAGSRMFFGTSGSYGSGVTKINMIMVDIGYVGINIGTTTPQYDLDVGGAGRFTQPIIVGAPTQDSHAATKSYADSILTGGAATGTLATLVVTGTTTLATTGGNVGIGTTTPERKLHISGVGWTSVALPSGGFTGDVLITGSGAYGPTLGLQATNAGGHLWNLFSTGASGLVGAGAFSIRDDTDAQYRLVIDKDGNFAFGEAITDSALTGAKMVIKNTGNVGIGTTTPSYKLDVAGAIRTNNQFISTLATGISPFSVTSATVNTNLNADLVDGYHSTTIYKNSDVVMPTNPFGGRQLYFSPEQNAYFLATKRWVVTGAQYLKSNDSFVSNYTAGQLAILFDGSYETYLLVAPGNYALITITFSTEPSGYYPGYPYGNFYLSHYYTYFPTAAFTNLDTLRVYCNYEPQGIGWKTMSFTDFLRTSSLITKASNSYYAISIAEFKMNANDTDNRWVSEIDVQLSRPGANEMPILDKFKANILYNTLTFENGSSVTNISLNPTGVSYINGGNVGIGTTTPTFNLDVAGTAHFRSTTTPSVIGLVVASNGNIGIASSSPGYGLTVAGTGYFSQPVIVGTPTDASHAATKNYVDTAVAGGGGGGSITTSSVASEGYFPYWASPSSLYGTSSIFQSGVNVGIGTTTPATLFTVATSTNIFNVTSAGNVGIGTTNPTHKLVLDNDGGILAKGAVEQGVNILDLEGNGSYLVWFPNKAAFRAGSLGANNNWDDYNMGIASIALGADTLASGDSAVALGSLTEAIGVGSTAINRSTEAIGDFSTAAGFYTKARPYASFAIGRYNSSFLSASTSSWVSTDPLFMIGIGDNTNQRKDAMVVYKDGRVVMGTSTPQGRFHVYTDTNNNAFVVTDDGKIGIGTSTPSSKLYVAGDIYSTGTVSGATLSGSLNAGYVSAGVFGSSATKGDYTFQAKADTNPILFIDATNKRVGIGTTTPSYNFDVSGTGRFTQPLIVGTPTQDGHAATKSYVDPYTVFLKKSGDAYTVNSGNIGIGDFSLTSPKAKLEVDGGVRLNTATIQPICDSNQRGTFWVVQSGALIKDKVEVCAKDAYDAYAWRTIY